MQATNKLHISAAALNLQLLAKKSSYLSLLLYTFTLRNLSLSNDDHYYILDY